VLSEFTETIRFTAPGDSTIPGALQNLQMFASFQNVLFVFDNGTDNDLAVYEYELYEEDDIVNPNTAPYALQSGATALKAGAGNSSVFAVPVEGSYIDVENDNVVVQKNFFGRVRAKDTSGNAGAWTSIVKTDPSTPLIDSQYIVSLTADKIKAGEIEAAEIVLGGANPSQTIIKSLTYDTSSGIQGWFIRGDGHFSLGGPNGITYDNETIVIGDDVQVTANLAADSISVPTTGTPKLNINSGIGGGVGGMTLGDPSYNYWYSNGNFRVGGASNYVIWNGSTLSVAGGITSTTGRIGPFDITSSSLISQGYSPRNFMKIENFGDVTVSSHPSSGPHLDMIHRTDIVGEYILIQREGVTGRYAIMGSPTGNVNGMEFSLVDNGTQRFLAKTDGTVFASGQISGASFSTGGNITASGAVYASNWFRSYGVSGWYNETYGGGIYMEDTTWVRVYNGKNFYVPGSQLIAGGLEVDGEIKADGSIAIAANTGYRSQGNFSTTTSTTITARIVDGGGFQVIRAQGSMRNLKDDIQPISSALDKLLRLRPVSFVEKPEGWEDELGLQLKSLDRHFGLIAEEVAEDLPELATFGYPGGYPMKTNEDGKEVVDQEELVKFEKYVPVSWREMGAIPLLIKAVQELSSKIDELESRMV
jgi:hypothetical protein